MFRKKFSKKSDKCLENSSKSSTFATHLRKKTGCSAVRLAHLLWEQGVPGSNPGTPTNEEKSIIGVVRMMDFYFIMISTKLSNIADETNLKMKYNEQNTEQIILEAAEAEFLEKGYNGAKMLSIARRAGVAHSMLHYYYRSKENLFQAVVLRKTDEIVPLFRGVFKQNLSFEEMLNRIREVRDRYIFSQSPQMPYFLLSEMLLKPENRGILLDLFNRIGSIQQARERLEEEIKAGRIRPISFEDFIFLLLTFDAASLTAIVACQRKEGVHSEVVAKLLASYRTHNMQLILEALRP